MKKLMLGMAVLASTACGADDVAIDAGPVPTTTDATTTTTTEAPPTTVETTTTTEAPQPVVEPEPILCPGRHPQHHSPCPPAPRRTATTDAYEPPSPQGQSTGRGSEPPAGDVWAALADCESGGDPTTNTGNGYYGALQFSLPTWRSVGETGLPSDYSYAHQIAAGKRLQARSGWGQWPACSRKLGLR